MLSLASVRLHRLCTGGVGLLLPEGPAVFGLFSVLAEFALDVGRGCKRDRKGDQGECMVADTCGLAVGPRRYWPKNGKWETRRCRC
ncbi:hypothetical protein SCYAM73S_00625 [Streptomyces cyaneofuscatus]|nr:hypothetical protein STIB_33760 [Streptomyces sp. IB2014 011-1]